MTSVHRVTRVARSGLVVLLTGVALAACQEPADRTVISVLAPDGTAALVREPGRTAFLERVDVRCPDCEVRIHSGGTSVQDLEGALDEGADVVVVEALTAVQGAELVTAAGAVPVVALDRFFAGADFFVSYDRASMGIVVAEAVADELDRSATALVVNGSTVDTDTDARRAGPARWTGLRPRRGGGGAGRRHRHLGGDPGLGGGPPRGARGTRRGCDRHGQ